MKKKHVCCAGALLLIIAISCVIAGCAPRALEVSADSGQALAASEAMPWSEDMNCATCHLAEEESASDTITTYAIHAEELASDCTSCHVDDDGTLTTAHEEYLESELPTKLRKTQVASEVCLDCHVQEELLVSTQDLTFLTDAYGTTVNPHALPETPEHMASINCSSCHKMHLSNDLTKTSRQLCMTCHHQGVYQCGAGACHA